MQTIPHLQFANLPTPIEFLSRLTAHLGGPKVYIKRDDLTGLAFGGNKTRKLEFLIPEALAHGARTLMTAGAIQSNHCRQTAAAAVKFGFNCILVLSGERPSKLSGNLLLDKLFGAEIVWADFTQRDEVLNQTFNAAWQAGKRPYLIPYGGSNPTGAIAYAYAIKELINQQNDNDDIPIMNWIVFPSSSGGTQAGMLVGAKLFGYPGKILGISVDEDEVDLRKKVSRLATETASLVDDSIRFMPEEILVNSNYIGAGYGILGAQEIEAIQLFARTEGILLDPVYTGRAAAGLIDLIRQNYFHNEDIVLF
jgi:D-cysteine desulfhydrase family pyridoxal phosphate-dependent enzyme